MPETQKPCVPDLDLRPFSTAYAKEVIAIYNAYVACGTAAFPEEPVADDFFNFLLEMPKRYPAYILWDKELERVIGFCFLSPFHPQPTFRKTALIDYFIAPEYTGKGLGRLCLRRLEADAKKAGISHLIADISSENLGSIAFHEKHGFRNCDAYEGIGHKLGRDFGIVHMQKDL